MSHAFEIVALSSYYRNLVPVLSKPQGVMSPHRFVVEKSSVYVTHHSPCRLSAALPSLQSLPVIIHPPMNHFSQHMVPLQFCSQFYACLIVVVLFGGASILAVVLMTLYGIGGVELIFTVCFMCFCGLLRILLSPWHATRNSFFSSSKDEGDMFEKQLAVDTYTLEEKGDVITSCSCCPICLRHFKAGDSLSMGRACGHVFHHDCLAMWLSKSTSCPYCRQDLEQRCTNVEPSNVHKTGAWGIFDGIFDSIYA